MKQGDRIEIKLNNGEHLIGYYQYTERNTIFVSPYSNGMYSIGTLKEDIKKIVEL